MSVSRVRLPPSILPDWLVYNLRLDAESGRLDDLFTGSTIKHLTGKSLAKDPILIPPREEQQEIASGVDSMFKLADTIEERVAGATARADNLTQAILAQAFRGDLVHTEAELARREGRDYEPASTLLERARATNRQQESPVSGRHRARERL